MGKRKRNGGTHGRDQTRKKKRTTEIDLIKELVLRSMDEAPPLGMNILMLDEAAAAEQNIKIPTKFAELPLTPETQKGLAEHKFLALRAIQRATLLHSLAERDVLGAARTGSGKTLCYLIPVLEILYRNRWNVEDGVGGLMVSPTRELATQIFEVLRKVGKYHRFSAALIIGGKNIKHEKARINQVNILVATPGRLIQHFDETYGFHCDNLKVLVLDEADQILDMGFQQQITQLLESLPRNRQTLLFSATLTKSVTKLAKLSLRNPQYIKCLEENKPTPNRLVESYIVMKEQDKINFLWTFIRTHVKQKIMVFLTTRKQVRFTYEIFRKLQPGCPVAHIHGKMVQPKRMATFYDFKERKGGCALFTTSVASRGLDFPDVDWVVLFDCPSDTQSYVHSVGRTARNFSKGYSLLVLVPSQKAFLSRLEKVRIKPKKMVIKAHKLRNITGSIASLLAENPEFKYLGERAFVSYIRSVYLESDKEVFKPKEVDIESLTKSMGLPGTPLVEGDSVDSNNRLKNMPYGLQELLGLTKKKKKGGDTYVDRLLNKSSAGVFSDSRVALRADEYQGQDDFFEAVDNNEPLQTAAQNPDDEEKQFLEDSEEEEEGELDEQLVAKLKQKVSEADLQDKLDDQKRVREMHQLNRWRALQERREDAKANTAHLTTVTLGDPDESEESSSEASGDESSSSSSSSEPDVSSLEAQALALASS